MQVQVFGRWVSVTPPPERAAHTQAMREVRDKQRRTWFKKGYRRVKDPRKVKGPIMESKKCASGAASPVTAGQLIEAGDKICGQYSKSIILEPQTWMILSSEFERLRDQESAREILNHIDGQLKKPGWCLTLATSLGYKVKEPL
jgi:hypothetical protein